MIAAVKRSPGKLAEVIVNAIAGWRVAENSARTSSRSRFGPPTKWPTASVAAVNGPSRGSCRHRPGPTTSAASGRPIRRARPLRRSPRSGSTARRASQRCSAGTLEEDAGDQRATEDRHHVAGDLTRWHVVWTLRDPPEQIDEQRYCDDRDRERDECDPSHPRHLDPLDDRDRDERREHEDRQQRQRDQAAAMPFIGRPEVLSPSGEGDQPAGRNCSGDAATRSSVTSPTKPPSRPASETRSSLLVASPSPRPSPSSRAQTMFGRDADSNT